MVEKGKYVIITAAKNEGKNIENTILSIVRQTVIPQLWVIVSDQSTDDTDDIIRKYEKEYSFMKLLRREKEENRNFGSQVRSINIGYEFIKRKQINYQYIGNLDADISLLPGYYEEIFEKFELNKNIGLAGGYIYEKDKDEFKVRKHNNLNSIAHGIQMFRRECFEEIGGYREMTYGGPDWVAEVLARKNGWEVKAFPNIKVFHHRHTLSEEGKLRGRYRQGLMDYSVGSLFMFEIFKCIRRFDSRPYVIGGLCRFVGFLSAMISGEKRAVPEDFVNYLQKEQICRIKKLLMLQNIYTQKDI